jgi:hypothetical protein
MDAMAVSREHAEPLETAYPDFESRQHPFHNAIVSGKSAYRYPCALVIIVSQYEKREEVHLADANQSAWTSGSSAPQLRVGRLGRNWLLSGPPLPSGPSSPRIQSAQGLRYTRH